MNALHHNEDWLYQKYWVEKLSMRKMGEIAGCHSAIILKWMQRKGIPRRSKSEALINDFGYDELCNKEWLETHYVTDGLTCSGIAKLIGCETSTVTKWLHIHGIKVRTGTASHISDGKPHHNREWLKKKYLDEQLSAIQIGKEIGIDGRVVTFWLKRFGIPRRTKKDISKLHSARPLVPRIYHDVELMKTLYVKRGMSMRDMAKKLACSQFTVNHWLRKHGIRIRSGEEGQRVSSMSKSSHGKPVFSTTELPVANALDKMGIKHVSQFSPKFCSYRYDEFIKPNILIEIHGVYWHAHPKYFPEPNEVQREKIKYDKMKADWATENGFAFVVIWEDEIAEKGAEYWIQQRIVPLL